MPSAEAISFESRASKRSPNAEPSKIFEPSKRDLKVIFTLSFDIAEGSVAAIVTVANPMLISVKLEGEKSCKSKVSDPAAVVLAMTSI